MLPDITDPKAVAESLKYLTREERIELDRLLSEGMPIWMPQVGPQTEALKCEADIIFYGGQAGGGKTDLLIGAALTEHQHSIIFRREAVQLVGIEERTTNILGSRTGYNGQGLWHIPGAGNRVVEFGSVKEPGDWMKFQGRPHDLKAFDEITHFLELQFRTLIGWMRTDNPKQRQRVICAGNPPTNAEGQWVIQFWGPWLDPLHPNPAKPGELRWYITNAEGKDQEVPGPGEYPVGTEMMTAMSRTFIRSSVDDNYYLTTTGYKATLQALPEPLRSQMLRGDFMAGASDAVWQLIPSEWAKAAQLRWKPRETKGPMTVIGFDIARGGIDNTVAARRHDTWFDELKMAPGVVTSDGPKAVAFLVPFIRKGVLIAIDAIGVGGAALDFCTGMGMKTLAVVGSEKSEMTDKSAQLRFRNKRAEMYWYLREALDPTNEDPISLPPDTDLLAELCSLRYKVVQHGKFAAIQVLDKDDIRKVLGRSPDRADAVAMTFLSDVPMAIAIAHADEYAEREAPDWRT